MNKGRVLILCERYFPDSTANTVCVDAVGKELIKNGYEVDYYVLRVCEEENKFIEGGEIVYLNNVYNESYYWLKKKLNIDYFGLSKPLRFLVNVWTRLKAIPYEYTCSNYADSVRIKRAIKEVAKRYAERPYDYMVSVTHPFGLTKLAQKIKSHFPNIKWTLYMLDPFVYNYTLAAAKIEKRKKQYLKYTSNVDGILLTDCIVEKANKEGFVVDKPYIEVALPILKEKKSVSVPIERYCMYAGLFYSDIRNPEKMFEILSALACKPKVVVAGKGCESIVAKYKEKMNDRLQIMGNLPYDECSKMIAGAGILINLGNTVENQLPSKVFDYIASGKPVINFFQGYDDPGYYYFEHYPLAYNINVKDYSIDDLKGLSDFIEANYGKVISYDEATVGLRDMCSELVLKRIIRFVTDDSEKQ